MGGEVVVQAQQLFRATLQRVGTLVRQTQFSRQEDEDQLERDEDEQRADASGSVDVRRQPGDDCDGRFSPAEGAIRGECSSGRSRHMPERRRRRCRR